MKEREGDRARKRNYKRKVKENTSKTNGNAGERERDKARREKESEKQRKTEGKRTGEDGLTLFVDADEKKPIQTSQPRRRACNPSPPPETVRKKDREKSKKT